MHEFAVGITEIAFSGAAGAGAAWTRPTGSPDPGIGVKPTPAATQTA